jgi:hypothetical protein
MVLAVSDYGERTHWAPGLLALARIVGGSGGVLVRSE